MSEYNVDSGNGKRLVLVGKSGPAFEVPGSGPLTNLEKGTEFAGAQAALDKMGVPRKFEGKRMTLPQRIYWLYGEMAALQWVIGAGNVFMIPVYEEKRGAE